MVIIPIRDVREEDGPSIGADLLHLGQLRQAGFPVPEGIIVTPPQINIKAVLEHFNLKDREIFEQRLTLIKAEIAKIPPPEQLSDEFDKRKLDHQKLWLHLLDFWLSEIRSRIWREGFSPDLTHNLSAQPIFFMDKISASGRAHYDYEDQVLVLEVEQGVLSKAQSEQLEKLVKDGNKKLMLPQVYDWNVDQKLSIVKITPFTHYLSQKSLEVIPQSDDPKKIQKSVIKVFLNLQNNFKPTAELDGVILSSEAVSDTDEKLLQLIEACQILGTSPVILKLFDKKDRLGKIRGTQYLIHEKSALKKDVEALHFLRNKQYCNNISLAIPFVRSPQELKELKQDLLGLKVSRSVSLKFWLEFAVPENLLNVDKYLDVGIDGILLNCDGLASWVGGFDPDDPDSVYYKSEIEVFLKLIEQTLPKIHKEKIPVIATGNLTLHDDVLSLLMEKGIWGLGVDGANVANIHDRIRLIERRLLNKSK